MRAQLVLLPLAIVATGGCSSECHVKSDTPKNAQQSAALSDAQKRADYCRSTHAKCEYRIEQSAEGTITIHVSYNYDEPDGSGCGGDLYEEWKYSSAGNLVEGS